MHTGGFHGDGNRKNIIIRNLSLHCLTAVDVAIDVRFVLLVPVVDTLAFADDVGCLARESGGFWGVVGYTSKDHQVA